MATANHVLLRRITLTASASSVTFDSIPQTGYTDLKLVISARTATGGAADMYVSFNSDTNQANYYMRQLQGSGSSAGSAGGSSNQGPVSNGSTDTASTFSNNEMYVPNYTGSTYKSFSVDSVTENNATTAYTTLRAVIWNNTSAITSINFVNNGGQSFATGSSFSLYGIADVNTTPLTAPKADGGDIIKTDGTYWYHAFLSTGTFKPQVNLSADVLVVAGGGASYNGVSSGENCGGGGAGGLLYFASQGLSASNYTCTIGSGGALGSNGGDSQFGSLTLVKGGGVSGLGSVANGANGGSGGGAGNNTLGGAATSGQGYAGGNGSANAASAYGAGGGGGAGAAGSPGTGSTGGAGGVGVSTYSSWGSATGLGQNVSGTYYFAGGGGGSSNIARGAGGYGGGGQGQDSTATGHVAGTPNTGGGGGGGRANQPGAAGGSGVIIIRYPV